MIKIAATVHIHRLTSTSGATTSAQITNTTNRAATADDANPGTANPIPIPSGSSVNYSYWVTTRLFVASAPTTDITNVKWYTDGANSLGTGVSAHGQGADPAKYVQASGTQGTTGTALNSTNHSGLVTSGGAAANSTDIFGFTSGSPKSLSGSIGATTGYFGQMFVYQVAVASNAGPGPSTAETVTWQFDQT